MVCLTHLGQEISDDLRSYRDLPSAPATPVEGDTAEAGTIAGSVLEQVIESYSGLNDAAACGTTSAVAGLKSTAVYSSLTIR